jgi:hypothetical protein
MNLFKLFILGLSLLAVIATQTKAFTVSPPQVIRIDSEDIFEAYRLAPLSRHLLATMPEWQMLLPAKWIASNSSVELCEPRPHSQVTVNISPEVVYIGDSVSTSKHRA